MTTTAGALITAVDAVVGQDLTALSVEQLEDAVAVAGPQAQRLAGFAALAASTLHVRVGGQLPTDTGGSRSVAGWMAETTTDTASAAGRLIVAPAQRRALTARDLGCAVIGCTRPPAMCDAHHLVRRSDGGPTTLHDLVLLCRRDHVLWHLGKIRLKHLRVP